MALAAATFAGGMVALALLSRAQPLGRAWVAAHAAGPYAFEGTTAARTPDGTARWLVAGRGEAAGVLTATVSRAPAEAGVANGADVPPEVDRAGETTWHIRWPAVVDAFGTPLARRAIGAVLPAGDPLALLAAGHGARVGGLEQVGDRACRRVDFLVGARAYGTWLEAHAGVLPVNGEAGGLWTFEGTGTAWLDPDTGRPCRIAARVELPRLVDDRPGIGEVDWTYAWP